MIRHRLTGQVARALRSTCLPILCVLLLPVGLLAQSGGTVQKPAADEVAARTDQGGGKAAANPAPEPDTWMLLGTGTVVLLLLYTRRRVRVTAPRAQPQQ